MDGMQDEVARVNEGAARQQGSQDGGQAAQTSVTDAVPGVGVSAGAVGTSVEGSDGGDATAEARADYEAALAEHDARIAELEGEIAEAAKTAEGAEKLRAEMDELCRKGDEERVGFELQLAGARNVKAARALLADHDNDIEKLKAAEPWLFSAPAAPAPTGATGLPSAGAAGADESTQMSRWRKIAGLPESEE